MKYRIFGTPEAYCNQIAYLLGVDPKGISSKRQYDYCNKKADIREDPIKETDVLTFMFKDGVTLDLSFPAGNKILVTRNVPKGTNLLNIKNCDKDELVMKNLKIEEGEKQLESKLEPVLDSVEETTEEPGEIVFQYYERTIQHLQKDPEAYTCQMFCDACYFIKEIKEAIC